MSELSDLIDAVLAVRRGVRSAANSNNRANLFDRQAAGERRLARLDASLVALGVDPRPLPEASLPIPSWWTVEGEP